MPSDDADLHFPMPQVRRSDVLPIRIRKRDHGWLRVPGDTTFAVAALGGQVLSAAWPPANPMDLKPLGRALALRLGFLFESWAVHNLNLSVLDLNEPLGTKAGQIPGNYLSNRPQARRKFLVGHREIEGLGARIF